MKLYILHGPGQVAMNNKISEIKKGFDPLAIVEVSSLAQIDTGTLFTDKRLIILEDGAGIDTTKLPGDENLTLILKFTKLLPSNSTLLKNLPKGANIISFEEAKETSIFPFLDMLCEKNPKALGELQKYLDEWGSQYVLTMMAYALRRFIYPGKNAKPYTLQKISQQKRNFPQDRIEKLYLSIIETDFKIKQGLLDQKLGMFMLAERFLT